MAIPFEPRPAGPLPPADTTGRLRALSEFVAWIGPAIGQGRELGSVDADLDLSEEARAGRDRAIVAAYGAIARICERTA